MSKQLRSIRVDDADWQRFHDAAKQVRTPLSAWIRETLLEACKTPAEQTAEPEPDSDPDAENTTPKPNTHEWLRQWGS
jgi:hypothetical protein